MVDMVYADIGIFRMDIYNDSNTATQQTWKVYLNSAEFNKCKLTRNKKLTKQRQMGAND